MHTCTKCMHASSAEPHGHTSAFPLSTLTPPPPLIQHWDPLLPRRHAHPNARPKEVWRFSDIAEVELLSRCCRTLNPADEDLYDQEAVALSEAVIKNGLAQFPGSPQLAVLYSNFLMEVGGALLCRKCCCVGSSAV